MSDEDDEAVEYQSGPFCRHWADPSDCEITCEREGCGHRCTQHDFEEPGECDECDCPGWTEKDDA